MLQLPQHRRHAARRPEPPRPGAKSTVTLADGRHIKATRAYLRRAISDPGADIVRGYPSQTMTAAIGHLHLDRRPDDIEALVESSLP